MSTNKTTETNRKILVICNYYLPGYKSGGSLRTIVNMIERLKDKFEFEVITLAHDGDKVPYKTVKINEWNTIEGIKVFYISDDKVKLSKLRELILKSRPDSIYLNSTFSTLTLIVLALRKLKLIPDIKIILAPEGELSLGALQLKAAKKRIFLKISKTLGLYQDLLWKTTSELEKKEVEDVIAQGGQIFIAPNMPPRNFLPEYNQQLKPKKEIGEAKFVFLSRYMRKKNLKWLLENLSGIKGNLLIDIYGPLEDKPYWDETEQLIKSLPQNIKVEYKGSILYEEGVKKLFEYHFFLLPTLGENFGHVFIEALAAGCPLVISDRTPWLNLKEKEIGWDLALEKPHQWVEVINECIRYSQGDYEKLSSNARSFADNWLSDPKVEADTLRVLQSSLEK